MRRFYHVALDMLFLLACAAAIAMASCAPAMFVDKGPFAFESGDTTALLVGCGEKAPVGHLYCRFQAGALPTGSVVVVVPPVACRADSCASVTIWPPDASQPLERTVAKGQSYVVIPWTALVGQMPFDNAQRGFWPVLVRWSWTDDKTGVELAAAAEGEIRLRVHSTAYSPLSFDPSQQTWTWSTGGVTYGATDKGRTAVAP